MRPDTSELQFFSDSWIQQRMLAERRSKGVDPMDELYGHRVRLHRLSNEVVSKIIGVLNDADGDIATQLEKTLNPFKRARLEALRLGLRALNHDVYQGFGNTPSRAEVANYKRHPGEFLIPTNDLLVAAATVDPFQGGKLLNELVSGLDTETLIRLRGAMRMSLIAGEGVADAVRRIRGTKAQAYKNGILEISRPSAEALAQTSIAQVVHEGKWLCYQENADILKGWGFVATLHCETCITCAALDGQVFPIGQAKDFNPPLHINCRCTTVPVVHGSAADKRITYNEWLKGQPASVQDEALGAMKAKLFREGGLSVTKFVDEKGRPLTLDQLKEIEPAAFVKAGL